MSGCNEHSEAQGNRVDDLSLGRLVDGQVRGTELRSLVTRLAQEPGGWRRCALAFLEAQAWRVAIAAVEKPTALDPEFDPLPRAGSFAPRPRVLLGAAMVLLGGFALGWFTGGGGGGADSLMPIQSRLPGDAHSSDDPLSTAGGESTEHHPPTSPHPFGYLNISAPQIVGDPPRSLRLPVLSGPGLDEAWLRSQPSFLPREVRRQWEDRGYQVDQKRRLISVQMDQEGHYLSIPVDEVQLRYVGDPL